MIGFTGNLTRVSTSLRTYTLISQLQQGSVRIYREEQRISTGKKLLSVSDSPIGAETIAWLKKSLQSLDQILANLQYADGQLSAADSAVSVMSYMLADAA